MNDTTPEVERHHPAASTQNPEVGQRRSGYSADRSSPPKTDSEPEQYGARGPSDDLECWINSAEVRRLCGNISNMSLHRWLAAQRLGFPKPAYVNGKRFWIKGDVLAWRAAQFAEAS